MGSHEFRTPRGASVMFEVRDGTSDWNTLFSCLNEDEYRLRELTLSGTALDIGAHIGGVTIGLAIDNPDLHVIAVEAVPPNVELLRRNIERNGVSDRVEVIEAAAGDGTPVTIRWGFSGNESAEHHAYIGNSLLGEPVSDFSRLDTLSMPLAEIIGDREIAFCKIDCEGCEYPVLQGPALERIVLIRGEIHGIADHQPDELAAQLLPTHTYERGDELPTWFEAVRRG